MSTRQNGTQGSGGDCGIGVGGRIVRGAWCLVPGAWCLWRDLRVEALDLTIAKAAAFPEGTPDVVVDSVFGTFGPEAAVLPVSGDVEALTGRPAHTFVQWVERNRAAFA